MLLTAFKHYGVGATPDTYGMTYIEFAHFVHDCKLFNITRDSTMIKKIYNASTGSKDQTRQLDKMYRASFLEACLRLAVVRNRVLGDEELSTSMALANAITDYFEPFVSQAFFIKIRMRRFELQA